MSGIMNMFVATKTTIATAVDAFFNSVSLLLNTSSTNGAQNNTFLDSSTNNFTITRNGNATQGTFTPFSQTGWSNYFTSAGISIPYAAPLQLQNTNWTIESYFNLSSASAEFCTMGASNGGGGVPKYFMGGNWNTSFGYSANRATFFTYTGADRWIDVPFTWQVGRWYHMAAVYTHSNTTITLYIDGVSVGSIAYGTGAVTGDILIGRNGEGGGPINGHISNFRYIVGTSLYTSNFTPSTTPLTAITNTQILTCQSNRFVDNSGNSRAVSIAAGTPSVQAFSPFLPTTAYDTAVVGGSGYFDGSGDYLTWPANLNLSNNNFTIEGWFYFTAWGTAAGGNGATLFRHTPNDRFLDLFVEQKKVKLVASGGGVTIDAFLGSTILQLNTWTHIALVRNGTTFTAYINGVAESSPITGVSSSFSNMASVSTGTGDNFITGYVSDLRVVNGTAVYTSGFTPPTAPLTAITNTNSLLKFTNAGIYDSASKNVLETVGNAQVSTTQAKWGTTSMAFDGSGDYLRARLNDPLVFLGSGDWTIEGWVYLNSTSGTQAFIIGQSDYANATNASYSLYVAGSSAGDFFYGSTNVALGAAGLSATTWTHCAWVRNGSTITFYRDGTSITSLTIGTNTINNGTTNPTCVGAANNGTSSLNGYIDDLRISKYARYTTTFTPPTAAFPLQ